MRVFRITTKGKLFSTLEIAATYPKKSIELLLKNSGYVAKIIESTKNESNCRVVDTTSLKEYYYKITELLTKKDYNIIQNAIETARRTGYDQVVYDTEDGYAFCRDYQDNTMDDKRKVKGKVITTYVGGIQKISYIPYYDNFKKGNETVINNL